MGDQAGIKMAELDNNLKENLYIRSNHSNYQYFLSPVFTGDFFCLVPVGLWLKE